MFKSLLSIAAFTCLTATAETTLSADSRFSFEAATDAFKTAQAPDLTQLVGKWMFVGSASAPKYNSQQDGYWPDGRFPLPGWPGSFYWYWLNAEGKDVFGNSRLTTVVQTVGAESGKVYTSISYSGKLTPTGYIFFMNKGNACNLDVECRLVPSNEMLLCDGTINDSRSGCQSGEVVTYSGFIKQP